MAAAAGVNVAEMVQLAAGARDAPQVVDFAKLAEFVPPRTMLEIVSDALPVFVSVTL